MQDHHENIIDKFYKNAITKSKNYLEKKYGLTICGDEDSDIVNISSSRPDYCKDSSNFWKIVVKSQIGQRILLVVIPDCFPDHFPRIFLTESDFKEIYPIPHLDKHGFICTRDPEVVALDDKLPEIALEELVKIAINIIEDGVNQANQDEFYAEFLAYWNDISDCKVLSLFEPPKEIIYLESFELSGRVFGLTNIISNSAEIISDWLIPYNVKIKNKFRALYIPLGTNFPHHFKDFNDAYEFLKGIGQAEILDGLKHYYSRSQSYYTIVCSVTFNGQEMLFGWIHQGWGNINIKGFRKGRAPFEVVLCQSRIRKMALTKVSLQRIDRMRLFNRVS